MKNIFLTCLCLLAALLLARAPCFAGESRFAVISMERVFDKHHKTREANAQLKLRLEAIEKERKEMMAEANSLKTEIETLRAESADKSLSEAAQRKKMESAKEKYERFAEAEDRLIRFDKSSKNELGEHMRDTQQEIVADIRKTVQRYVKGRNIVLVLDKSGKTMNGVEPIIYFDSALDITDEIIALLNERTQEK